MADALSARRPDSTGLGVLNGTRVPANPQQLCRVLACSGRWMLGIFGQPDQANMTVNILRRAVCASALAAVYGKSYAANVKSPRRDEVAQAKDLVDSYYGDKTSLYVAKDLLDSALAKNPKNAAAYVQYGRLVAKGGVTSPGHLEGTTDANAQALLYKALSIDPRSPRVYTYLAEHARLADDLPAAFELLRKSDKIDPVDPSFWNGWAKYYEATGDQEAALRYFHRLDAKGPGHSIDSRKFYVEASVGPGSRSHLCRRCRGSQNARLRCRTSPANERRMDVEQLR